MKELAEHLVEIGQSAPNPLLSVAWLAEDEDGKMIGHIVLHSVPIVEGLKVDPSYQGNGVAFELMKRAQEFIVNSKAPRVLMHTDHPVMERILKHEPYGCTELKSKYLEWNRHV